MEGKKMVTQEQDQADINMWAVFGGKAQMEARQKEILKEIFE